MGVRLPPSVQEIQKILGRFDPNIGFSFTPFGADQYAQPAAFEGFESVLVSCIVTQIRNRCAGWKLLQNFPNRVALVRLWGTQFDTTVEFQQLHFAVACDLQPSLQYELANCLGFAFAAPTPVNGNAAGFVFCCLAQALCLQPAISFHQGLDKIFINAGHLHNAIRVTALRSVQAPDHRIWIDAEQGNYVICLAAGDDENLCTSPAKYLLQNTGDARIGYSFRALYTERGKCPVIVEQQRRLWGLRHFFKKLRYVVLCCRFNQLTSSNLLTHARDRAHFILRYLVLIQTQFTKLRHKSRGP